MKDPTRRSRGQLRAWVVMLPLMAGLFLLLGLGLVLETLVTLPRAYDELSASGVTTTAHVVSCTYGRTWNCDLRYQWEGRSITFSYPQNLNQFRDVTPQQPISLVVDPKNSSVRYTRLDVDTRYEAGFGWATVGGIGIALAGVGCFALWKHTRRRLRALRSQMTGSAAQVQGDRRAAQLGHPRSP